MYQIKLLLYGGMLDCWTEKLVPLTQGPTNLENTAFSMEYFEKKCFKIIRITFFFFSVKTTRLIFVAFPSYIAAFAAWMRSRVNFPTLNFEPATERQKSQWLNSSHKVIAKNLPFDKIHMVSFFFILKQ